MSQLTDNDTLSLAPVVWHGMDCNPGWVTDEFTAIVTLVEGWYGSPPLEGNNRDRALSDGAAYGHKILGPRQVTISGAAVGPREPLMDWRNQLAYRAAFRLPVELTIGDPILGTMLTTLGRADTDTFRHEFFAGATAFRWQVTITCGDPNVYETDWHRLVLTTSTAADAGRTYDRAYDQAVGGEGWQYGAPDPPGSSGYLVNAGNTDAPVYAVYTGDLATSRLTDGEASILLAAVPAGVEIALRTDTLQAEAPGGQPRASWVLTGSMPMFIPPFSTARWHLYSQGSGQVELLWRSAWV